MTVDVLAHGIGGRADLPVPLWAALYAGAFAILVSFFGVVALWPKPRLSGSAAGRPLGRAVTSFADSRGVRWSLEAVGLGAWAMLLGYSWFGPTSPNDNPAGTWFYVWLWVGFVFVSIIAGPIYRLINPLRTTARLIGLLVKPLGKSLGNPEALERLRYRPAIVGLFAFLSVELVFQPRSIIAVAWFVSIYSVAVIAAGVYYGPRWFERGDGFEVYFSLCARMSPLGRNAAGQLVFRSPFNSLLAGPHDRGLTAVVLTGLGSTAFDGFSRLQFWVDLDNEAKAISRETSYALGIAGLIVAILLVSAVYIGAIALTKPYVRRVHQGNPVEPFGMFVHTLIPIMVGYTVAHYFSFFVFQGQAGVSLTAAANINYAVVSTGQIAVIQILAIITGHIFGVVSAHDRALEILIPRYSKIGQFPILALMVGYTVTGIELVSGGRQMLNADFMGLSLGAYGDVVSILGPLMIVIGLVVVARLNVPSPKEVERASR